MKAFSKSAVLHWVDNSSCLVWMECCKIIKLIRRGVHSTKPYKVLKNADETVI